jgi:hypothetical protein
MCGISAIIPDDFYLIFEYRSIFQITNGVAIATGRAKYGALSSHKVIVTIKSPATDESKKPVLLTPRTLPDAQPSNPMHDAHKPQHHQTPATNPKPPEP